MLFRALCFALLLSGVFDNGRLYNAGAVLTGRYQGSPAETGSALRYIIAPRWG